MSSQISSRTILSQAERMAQLVTPLGKDKLVLTRFDVFEGMSELFEIKVEALSESEDLDFKLALGKECTVSYDTYNGATRFFSGILTEAQWIGVTEGFFAYRMVLRPWLWRLGKMQNSRIFKQRTVKDIIKQVFEEHGVSDQFKETITRDSGTLEYCVQYRESDLAFVSRLMEEYGFYTFYKHEDGKHTLHMVDSVSGHEEVEVDTPVRIERGPSGEVRLVKGPTVPFIPLAGDDRRDCEHIYDWMAERRYRTGKFELRDYDYMKATQQLKSEKLTTETYERARDTESYDYPGRWTEQDEGDHLVKVRLEAEQAIDHRMYAAGDAASLYPGALFKMERHTTDDADYLVVRATHSFGIQRYRSTGGEMNEEVYYGRYEVQDKQTPFRAPQVTPKPRVFGPQTAFVVARDGTPSNEEIDVDKDGRIFVNFHWNRGDKNKLCSRAVRVAQVWAGKGWGFQFIPRIGMEVVVEFLEGDPDFPMVTGCVYNSNFNYPYKLPDHKTQSGIKTDSTIDQGNDAYNEFRFEDKKGSEEVYFRAEKDHTELIQNIETRTILNHQVETIGKNFDGKGGKGGSKHDKPSRMVTIENGSDGLWIKNGDRVAQLDKGDDILYMALGDKRTRLVAGDYDLDVNGSVTVKAATFIRLEISGGGCFIELTPAGITLKGPLIQIN